MKRQILLLLALLTILVVNPATASTQDTERHVWSFDAQTIAKGYTISSPDDSFNVGVLPNVLKGETDVTIKIFDHAEYKQREVYQMYASAVQDNEDPYRIVQEWPIPEGKEIITPIFEFDIKGAADLYNPEKPLWLRMHYPAATLENKGVYYWNKTAQSWIEIPANVDQNSRAIQVAIHLTYAPMAILADIIPETGTASWYKYQDCNCAASRHYPAGSLLKVSTIDDARFVLVEVNDYGPEEWTGRLIDLDVTVFDKLAARSLGLIEVKVEPYIMTEEAFEQGEMPELFDL